MQRTAVRTLILLIAAIVTAGLYSHTHAAEFTGASLAAAPTVQAVCDTDADCAAWDAAHGIVSDGTPGNSALEPVPAAVTDHAISEDDPAFDCRFDGNRQCGIGSDVGGPVLTPASDGGAGYVCSDPDGVLGQNQLGIVVCTYGSDQV